MHLPDDLNDLLRTAKGSALVLDDSDEQFIKEIMRSICRDNAAGVILAKQPGKNGRLQFILMNTDQHDAITVLAEVMVQLAKSKPED